jgi:hypothetical protein
MSKKAEHEEAQQKLASVFSQRLGDIVTPHGVIKYDQVIQLPVEVANELVASFPELRIIA